MHSPDPSLFFIIGRPRSGTTLLRTLLDGHPRIKVPPEYPVVLGLFNQFGKVKKWDQAVFEAFFEAFKRPLPSDNWQYNYLRINESALWEELRRLPEDVTFERVFKCFYMHYTSIFPGKEDVTYVGDKNPIFATYPFRLRRIFPNARFIFITRDYRDNFLSVRRFKFEAPVIGLQAFRWKYTGKLALRFMERFPEQSLHIRHEDLIDNPGNTLKVVCDFLGLQYNRVMFDYPLYKDKIAEIVDSSLLEQFHGGLSKPVNDSSSRKWKTGLTGNEICAADMVVGWYAEKLGYLRHSRKFCLGPWLASLPWQWYGFSLYKAMSLAEYLPTAARRRFAMFLPALARVYHSRLRKNN